MNDVQKEIANLQKETETLYEQVRVLEVLLIFAVGIMGLLFIKLGMQYIELTIKYREILNSYKECLETLQSLYSVLQQIATTL